MKKFVIFFSLILCFTLNFTNINAQSLFNKFRAKAGYIKAESYAKNSGGLAEPVLQMIGTINQTIPFNEIEIKIEFDMDNGTSSGWIYIFKDKADTTKGGSYFVVKPILGDYLIVEIPGLNLPEMGLPIEENQYLNDYTWIDSDDMVNKLKSNSDFLDFYNQYKPFETLMIGLFIGINPFEQGNFNVNPMWGITIATSEYQKMCIVNAINGEVTCSPIFTEVKDNIIANNFEFYPNPANDFINLNVSELSNNNTYQITDIYGRTLKTSSLILGNNKVDISNFSSGIYYLILDGKVSKFIKQ